MKYERFEWHDRKARKNVRDHGVTFEEATGVFDDPNAIDEIDGSMDYDEERSIPCRNGRQPAAGGGLHDAR